MYAQTLSEALTLNEIIYLKKQVWWTGCTETPFICRGGIYNKNSYLLVITDTRGVWVTKADDQQIIEEKDKFNQSIKIKFEDILKTLDTPLRFGRSNTQFTKLQFKKNREEDLIFLMEFQVGIYPFKWEFFLTKMDDTEIFNILADDLLNPMAKTIMSLEKRGDSFKQKCIQIEKELLKRLSEKERNTYLSCVDKDNEEVWSNFLIADSQDDKLTNFDFGPAAQFFFSIHNSKNLIEGQENKKISVNQQSDIIDNNEDLKRMKLIQDYFSTFEEQPLSNAYLRPDSKKKFKQIDYQEESYQYKQKNQQLGIKVNYEEQNENKINNQQIQIQPKVQKEEKKKKKRLDFL
ncbi:hypothetical protein ABPG72_018474 [Tetrahymena utriculariae]